MSSQPEPFARASLEPGAMFGALAAEAELATGTDKQTALHNLQTLVPYRRMVLVALCAELTNGHLRIVRGADNSWIHIHGFTRTRCAVLFVAEQIGATGCTSRRHTIDEGIVSSDIRNMWIRSGFATDAR